jgi:type IV pilus assembly protein PilM
MLSIDVGSKKVCVIEGTFNKGTVDVTDFNEIEYTSEVVVNGDIRDKSALGFLINEIIKTKNMKSKSVVVTINSTDIVAREFKLPNIKIPKLRLLVNNEMLRIVGSDIEYVIDFVITSIAADNMIMVTAYAVSKDMVESYFNLIRDLKLKPFSLDTSANCIYKLMSESSINGKDHTEGNIIIVDIGYSQISMHGFTNGTYRFNRTEISPFQEFIREIGAINRIDITSDYLSQMDVSPDFEYENKVVTDTCKYFVYRVSEEIQRYTQYILLNSTSKTVFQIYICGGASSLKGMAPALSNSLKIPVEVLESVGRVNIPANCSLSKICSAAGALIRL